MHVVGIHIYMCKCTGLYVYVVVRGDGDKVVWFQLSRNQDTVGWKRYIYNLYYTLESSIFVPYYR